MGRLSEFYSTRDRYQTMRQVAAGLARLGRITEAEIMDEEANELAKFPVMVEYHCIPGDHSFFIGCSVADGSTPGENGICADCSEKLEEAIREIFPG